MINYSHMLYNVTKTSGSGAGGWARGCRPWRTAPGVRTAARRPRGEARLQRCSDAYGKAVARAEAKLQRYSSIIWK